MIISLLFLFSLLIILFFLSRLLTKALYLLFFLFTNNQKTSVHLLAYFLLPGTLVHEISHLFMAGILGVPTGELSIIPQIEEKEVKTGTLKIAKTDPFRRTLIGFAPTLIGSSLMVFITLFILKLENLSPKQLAVLFSNPLNLILFYLLITISSSMFSSKKDLEAIFIPLLIFFCFVIAFYLGGFKLFFSQKILNSLTSFLKNLNTAFLLAVLLEGVFLIILKLLLFLRGLTLIILPLIM